jgi:hypothetical protein
LVCGFFCPDSSYCILAGERHGVGSHQDDVLQKSAGPFDVLSSVIF